MSERGNVRYLWVLVGGYLLYLAYQQGRLLYEGTDQPVICIVSGVLFAAVGAAVLWREWQAWRYAQAHKDDPETWGTESPQDGEQAEQQQPPAQEREERNT